MKLVSHSRYDNIDSELVLPVKVHSCGLPSSSVLVANSIEVSSAYVALLTHCSQSCFLSSLAFQHNTFSLNLLPSLRLLAHLAASCVEGICNIHCALLYYLIKLDKLINSSTTQA